MNVITLLSVGFILLPGIVANLVYNTWNKNKKQKDWQDLLDIFLYSAVSYAIAGCLKWLFSSRQGDLFSVLKTFFTDSDNLPLDIVLISIGVGFFLGLLASYNTKYRLLLKIGNTIKATSLSSKDDVWTDALEMCRGEYVVVEDHKGGKLYYGWVSKYSFGGEKRELVLADVDVYPLNPDNQTREPIAREPYIYLSREDNELTITIKKSQRKRDWWQNFLSSFGKLFRKLFKRRTDSSNVDQGDSAVTTSVEIPERTPDATRV